MVETRVLRRNIRCRTYIDSHECCDLMEREQHDQNLLRLEDAKRIVRVIVLKHIASKIHATGVIAYHSVYHSDSCAVGQPT